ncbi:MAG: hypothetical protein A2589_01720 [Candidatus Vogelbacteria bacterium RIFOXYD1_FULL_46_19]|uniref:Uncharacterized protein n=1 Tax=Candidatus Vogelbacteria bacterium RIFOXYD1_FULL_46_19 TaxID=1802439 RepID=A0A1G2QHV2_9BACT|nr:MAG: hypothetical protein A2589_01720 [Candidatus Vogelbacteria bacterium RIFOXYD1_FULL_46_19]
MARETPEDHVTDGFQKGYEAESDSPNTGAISGGFAGLLGSEQFSNEHEQGREAACQDRDASVRNRGY